MWWSNRIWVLKNVIAYYAYHIKGLGCVYVTLQDVSLITNPWQYKWPGGAISAEDISSEYSSIWEILGALTGH